MRALKTLEPMHGHGIGVRLAQISGGVVRVNAGSRFPAPRRLERDCRVDGDWPTTKNNRGARDYRLTTAGHAQLRLKARDWEGQTSPIARVLNATPEEL